MTTQRHSRFLFASVAAISPLFVLGGCGASVLVPAASAKVISGAPNAAFQEAAGVRCSADTGAWPDRAAKPPSNVVAVKVRVRNESGKAIQLLAEDFVLVGK